MIDAVTVKSENDDEVHFISRGEMGQTLAAPEAPNSPFSEASSSPLPEAGSKLVRKSKKRKSAKWQGDWIEHKKVCLLIYLFLSLLTITSTAQSRSMEDINHYLWLLNPDTFRVWSTPAAEERHFHIPAICKSRARCTLPRA